MPTSVLIDGTSIPAKPGGVARYIEQLATQLAQFDEVAITIVCQQRNAGRFAELVGRERVHAIPGRFASVPMRLLWEQLVLPRLARRLRADVIHSPHYTMPLLTRLPRVVTLHDATFFSLPQAHSLAKRLFFRTWIRFSARRAKACITPSAATRDEVIRYIGDRHTRMLVAYSGVDPSVFHRPTRAQVEHASGKASLDGAEWIAFLATIEPRKNLGALVAAFVELWQDEDVRHRHPRLVLAIAGADGWGETAAELIADAGPDVPIRRLGYLPTEELAGYLGGATIFAYPSLGEGFGLPVLEAMACGSAVLTTRELALPEVGGDAVEYTTTDADSIAQALRRLLDHPERRAALGKAGVARAAGFTWAASARVHLAAFQEAAGQPRVAEANR